jgi:polyhydroxyalkanoate synthesis regulator phasin
MPSPPRVPDDLMKQLHEANARFHEHKQRLEEMQGASDYSHQTHLDRAEEQLKAVERELEEINRKIHEAMKE